MNWYVFYYVSIYHIRNQIKQRYDYTLTLIKREKKEHNLMILYGHAISQITCLREHFFSSFFNNDYQKMQIKTSDT